MQKLLNTGDERAAKFENQPYLEALLQQVSRFRSLSLSLAKAANQVDSNSDAMNQHLRRALA